MPENFQYDVFLSHSSKDKPIVRPLAERLRNDGLHVFFDEGEIRPGDSIPSRIEEGLERSRVLVLCMSANAFASDWAALESQTFRFRDPMNKELRFIPLRLEDVTPKGTLAQFSYINWLPPDREQNYNKLLEACRPPATPQVFQQPPGTVSTIKQVNFWNFSHQRNPVFTGRSELLDQIRADLKANHRQAIYGLGGIGKTQIAVEYAFRHRNDYSDVFWVFADSEQSISNDFIQIAKKLGLPGHDLPEQAVVVRTVMRWLEENEDWLLIFDNVENAQTVCPFLPVQSRGHVLLTSRGPAFQSVGIMNSRDIKVLPPEAARDFFLRRTGRAGSPDKDTALAGELAKEMGFFPLALEQAGAFISENQTSFETYLKSYRYRHVELLSEQAPVLGEYKDTVATTWAINFAEVEKSPASADLLRLSAFLWPEMVPLELFEKAASELGERLSLALASVQTDPVQLDQLLKPLTKYSLISRNPSTRSYSIHLLVQEVLRERMSGDEKRSWSETVVRVVSAVFPEGEFKNWPECERLLSQALLCQKYIFEYSFESPAAANLLRHAGFYLHKRAQFSQAQSMYQAALAMRQKIYGGEHADTADSLGKLGGLYSDQAHYKDAEDLLRQALEIREKKLGSEHPETATSANGLAVLCLTLAKFEEAETLFRSALSVREKIFDLDHPQVAESLKGLADLLEALGKYSEAEPLCRRAFAIREKAHGTDHPDIASSLGDLAGLLGAQGKYHEAEPLSRHALAINEKVLGAEHPDTSVALNNLAGVLRAQGKYREAEPLYRRALSIDEKVLGPEHPNTAAALNNLARLLSAQGKYREAEPLSQRALDIEKNALGLEHPGTAASLHSLAALLQEEGKYGEAEPLSRHALAIYEKVLGPEHPSIAAALNNLAGLLQELGKYQEAEPLQRRALAIDEKALGANHPGTATDLTNLAGLLQELGKYQQAEPLLRRALDIDEKALGSNHPGTATDLTNLAGLLQAQGKCREAEPLSHRALAVSETALGKDHPNVARDLNNLATILEELGQNEKAESLCRRALAIIEASVGTEHPRTATGLNNLATILRNRGKYNEAEPLYRRALAIREKVFHRSHPDIANSLAGLASIHRRLGKNKKAKGLEQRARKIMRKKH